MAIYFSYPVTWFYYKTQKSHSRGYMRIAGIKRRYMHVSDGKQSVSLPIAVLDFAISELKKRQKIYLKKIDKDKIVMDFDKGLDAFYKFQKFKWHKNISGQVYSNAYLLWRQKTNSLNEPEEKELRWRLKNNTGGINDLK